MLQKKEHLGRHSIQSYTFFGGGQTFGKNLGDEVQD
tara:strand:+ start:92 stop:199 length:108 start_codon:yes stop_codon:yes gene_type:complete